MEEIELTLLMPCLNEAETLPICIKKALKSLADNKINGEVLIADNGSTDGSQQIAIDLGARVVSVEQKGYGSALIGGTKVAKGKYVIMADSDDSYDWTNIMPYVERLRQGDDLVMGNRFKGGIEKGAMPSLHKYLGTPVLSFIGRLFYKNNIGDFNCGMRGYNRNTFLSLDLRCTGMEYASEMIVKASINGIKISEVPTPLKKDGRNRPPYLRSWSDGWRHLKFLLMHAPNWLFLYPSIVLISLSIISMLFLESGSLNLFSIEFDIHTLLYTSMFFTVGLQLLFFALTAHKIGINSNFLPDSGLLSRMMHTLSMERSIWIGVTLILIGIVLTIFAIIQWKKTGFGNLDVRQTMRLTIPAVTLIVSGLLFFFNGFIFGILDIKK